MVKKGYLVLEDGSMLEGQSFGYEKNLSGEVVFSTSMVGYPESLTDPSYFGQIVIFAYPLIGNYGVPKQELQDINCSATFESERIWTRGIIVANYMDTPHHYESVKTLSQWLKEEKVPALTGIDTRALIQKLREKGVMKGKIVFQKHAVEPFVNINVTNLVDYVSIDNPIQYKAKKKRFNKPILVFDCGMKHGILRQLLNQQFSIHRVPWDYSPKELGQYSGIVISNGPGDPVMANHTITTIRRCLEKKLPVFGICLGNQILALAAGGKTYKLKYGHRSSNQPVVDTFTKKAFITTQNHGFAVDMSSLSSVWKEWFVNLNDRTNEGIRHISEPFFTIQFHAEASPGPEDTLWMFDYFAQVVETYERSETS